MSIKICQLYNEKLNKCSARQNWMAYPVLLNFNPILNSGDHRGSLASPSNHEAWW